MNLLEAAEMYRARKAAERAGHPSANGSVNGANGDRGHLRVVGSTSTYGMSALAGACAEVRACPPGGRNAMLNTQAFKVAQLVANGHVDPEDALRELRSAGLDAGLPTSEVDLVLRAGETGAMAAGQDVPRAVELRGSTAVDPSLLAWTPPNGLMSKAGQPGQQPAAAATTPQDASAQQQDQQAPFPEPTPEEREQRAREGMLAGEVRAQWVRRAAKAVLDAEEAEHASAAVKALSGSYVDGAQFVLDLPEGTPSVWGRGEQVLWAQGESLIIVAGNGAGKTTLAGQLVRARLGLSQEVLGYPVTPGRRVLYLAMDRPRQIARSLHRIFTPVEREQLADRLRIWPGPPPADLARHPDTLAEMALDVGADTVIVDSLKDAAVGLSEDEVGAGWNRARQTAIRAGVELVELHHNVKRGANGGEPNSIADVYGSVWITGGAGSVIYLAGGPGDPVVTLRHLKQPAELVGPLTVVHSGGFSHVQAGRSVLDLLAVQPLSVPELTIAIYEVGEPSRADKERVRRQVGDLIDKGLVESTRGRNGGVGGSTATLYRRTEAGAQSAAATRSRATAEELVWVPGNE